MSTLPSTDVLAGMLAEHASKLPISDREVEYIIDRLTKIGTFQNIFNWGGISCLLPHEHGDGISCARIGPIFDRKYIRIYGSNEEGLADLFRIAHHATLGGPVENLLENLSGTDHAGDGVSSCYYCGKPYCVAKCGDLPCCYCGKPWRGPTREETTLHGYRSIESVASDDEAFGSFVDNLDGMSGVVSDLEDRVVKSAVLSFCRGVLKDEKKAESVAGVIDDLKDKIVRSGVVSFCRGEISAAAKAEKADKLSGFLADQFGPNEEAQRRVEEVAAQWVALKKKMDADPKIDKMLRASYDHWISFWGKYQKRNDFWVTVPELKDLATDVRAVIAEVNMARANAEDKFVQDLPVCKPGEKGLACKTEDVKAGASDAQATSQDIVDAPEKIKEKLSEVASENKWKIVGAGVAAALALAVTAKVML